MESTDAKRTSSKASTSSRSKSTPSSSAADVSPFDAAGAYTSQLHPRITSIMAPFHKNSRVSGCLQVRCPRRVLRRWRSCTHLSSTHLRLPCPSLACPWVTCRAHLQAKPLPQVTKKMPPTVCTITHVYMLALVVFSAALNPYAGAYPWMSPFGGLPTSLPPLSSSMLSPSSTPVTSSAKSSTATTTTASGSSTPKVTSSPLATSVSSLAWPNTATSKSSKKSTTAPVTSATSDAKTSDSNKRTSSGKRGKSSNRKVTSVNGSSSQANADAANRQAMDALAAAAAASMYPPGLNPAAFYPGLFPPPPSASDPLLNPAAASQFLFPFGMGGAPGMPDPALAAALGLPMPGLGGAGMFGLGSDRNATPFSASSLLSPSAISQASPRSTTTTTRERSRHSSASSSVATPSAPRDKHKSSHSKNATPATSGTNDVRRSYEEEMLKQLQESMFGAAMTSLVPPDRSHSPANDVSTRNRTASTSSTSSAMQKLSEYTRDSLRKKVYLFLLVAFFKPNAPTHPSPHAFSPLLKRRFSLSKLFQLIKTFDKKIRYGCTVFPFSSPVFSFCYDKTFYVRTCF